MSIDFKMVRNDICIHAFYNRPPHLYYKASNEPRFEKYSPAIATSNKGVVPSTGYVHPFMNVFFII